MIELGKEDAKKVVEMGHNQVNQMYKEWKKSEKLREEFKQFHHYLYQ